jgi:hypothetical protein
MKRQFGLALVATVAMLPAFAQAPGAPGPNSQGSFQQGSFQDDSGDAPDHGVARLSLMNGNVSIAHGDNGDLTAGAMNAPLVATDRVLTAENSRAEVQFDAVNMLRLAPMTEVRLGELQYKRYLVQIAQGTVTFRVLRDSDAQVDISTPNSSVRPVRAGTYRVTVHGDGTSEVTVRDGEAEIFSPTGSEPLRSGSTMMSRGSANDPEFRTMNAIPFDDWDRWNSDRDRAFERANDSSRYASPDIYGTEDLANHGRWVWDPSYGYVWVPDVNADWAPYRNGRWSYIDYYGWSWVSYDPWGWAPYHYGRWYRGGFGWAWYPGPVASHYYWRPALVGFFGWGSPGFGMSVGFGFGNVGWVPLAPHEPYRPWYGHNVYANRGNVINSGNVVNVYQNARYSNSVTSVRAGDFGRASINGNNFIRGNSGDFARAGMVNGTMPFSPTRDARQFAGREVNTQSFPRANGNTRFFAAPQAASTGPGAAVNPGGGWRRIDSGSAGVTPGNAPNTGGAPRFQQGTAAEPGFSRGGGNTGGGFSSAPRGQEPVQIRPPIVTNRNGFNNANPNANPANSGQGFREGGNAGANSGFGNFGGPRRSFESRPAQASPAPAPAHRSPGGGFHPAAPSGGGGAPHGAPGGGGNRGGGGGGGHSGGNRGGGGGHNH